MVSTFYGETCIPEWSNLIGGSCCWRSLEKLGGEWSKTQTLFGRRIGTTFHGDEVGGPVRLLGQARDIKQALIGRQPRFYLSFSFVL